MNLRRITLLPALTTLLASLLLSGCFQPGPEASLEVAAKGLYSGDISTEGDQFVIGSIYHGGSFWRGKERVFNWNHKADDKTVIVATDFSPDGNWVITAEARALVLWSTRTGQASQYLATPADVLDVALGPNGNYALVGMTDNSALLYSLRQKAVVRVLPHNNSVRSVAISDDGRLGLTGSEDTTATLWDLDSGRPLQRMQHADDVQQVALSPDGSIALTAAQYDKAILWRTRNGEVIGELPLGAERLKRGTRFTAARFSADGGQLLTGMPNQEVQLWDVNRLTLLNQWRLPKRQAWKPTSAAVVAVSFDQRPGIYHVLASDGFKHDLKR